MSRVVVKAMITKGHMDLRSMHRNTIDAGSKNEKLLMRIIESNKDTEFGRKYGFADIRSVSDYRRMVPITTYHDFEPYTDRMIHNGESNLITAQKVVGYAQSSGSIGARKFVPLTQPEVNIYTKYTVTRMLACADNYFRARTGRGIKPFRGMFVCQSYDDTLPDGTLCSNVADVAAKQLGFVYPYILNVPFKKLFNDEEGDFRYINSRFALEDRDCLYMFCVFMKAFTDLMRYYENNWETLVDDIEKGTISDLSRTTPEVREKLLKVIKPNPERAAELRKEFSKGFDPTIIKRIWPNMSVICGIGTSTFEAFSRIARGYTEGVPLDFSIYGASEGLFAAVDAVESPGQLMLVDSCYYEFIPVGDESKVLGLHELETGQQYEIVITNQAGLYRYKCGDVVKVVGYMNECPYIRFSYRQGQLLNVTGEKTTEEHMRAVLDKIEKESGVTIANWAVYTRLDVHPYHYVLLIENEDGVDLSGYSKMADEALQEINVRYKYFVDRNTLGRITIENQRFGTNKEWADQQVARGVPVSQVKPVRILDTDAKEQFFLSRLAN